MVERVPAPLLTALADLMKWLDATQMPSMVIGGVAASFLGEPRLTQDIDALAILPETDWAAAVTAATSYGIVPRIENPLDFARRTRILLMKHAQSGIDIDVAFGGLPFEHTALEQSKVYTIGGIRVRLPKVEDLLIMKAIAHRPKDLLDIEGLLNTHPEADIAVVRQCVREFATAIGMSDMMEDLEKLLSRRKTKPKAAAKAQSGQSSKPKPKAKRKR